MQSFPPTIVWRHKKENLKKCSLRGLESRPDFRFFVFPTTDLPDLTNYILLTIEAPSLSENDCDKGLLVLDATWRYAKKMHLRAEQHPGLVYRSIPAHYRTAYPRRQEDCPDPERGLASIEAIYAAYQLMGRNTDGLLDTYYWKDIFLQKNGSQKSEAGRNNTHNILISDWRCCTNQDYVAVSRLNILSNI